MFILTALFLILSGSIAVYADAPPEPQNGIITGTTMTVTISEVAAKACREEGGCILVTVSRVQQDTKDMARLVEIAKQCFAKKYKAI